ncbi:unnamed protein product, partial [Effrenium voratum]
LRPPREARRAEWGVPLRGAALCREGPDQGGWPDRGRVLDPFAGRLRQRPPEASQE